MTATSSTTSGWWRFRGRSHIPKSLAGLRLVLTLYHQRRRIFQ